MLASVSQAYRQWDQRLVIAIYAAVGVRVYNLPIRTKDVKNG